MGFHFNQKFSAVVSRTRLRVFTSLYFSSLSNDRRAVCSSGAKKVFLVLDTSKCLPHSRLGQSPEGLGGGRSPHPRKLQGTELVLAFGTSWEQVLSPHWGHAPLPWVRRHPGWCRERRWAAREKPAGLTPAALVGGLFRGRQ